MVLEDLFFAPSFFTLPQPVHHISAHPYSFFPCPNDAWTGLYIKLCREPTFLVFSLIYIPFDFLCGIVVKILDIDKISLNRFTAACAILSTPRFLSTPRCV